MKLTGYYMTAVAKTELAGRLGLPSDCEVF